MAPCGKCNGPVATGKNAEKSVKCTDCKTAFHERCIEIASDGTWVCPTCNPSLRDVMAFLRQQGKTLQAANEKISKVSDTVTVIADELSSLKTENEALKKRVRELESRLADTEQYSRVNDVDVHGVPYRAGENVSAILDDLGRALGCPIKPEMIDVAHRTGPPSAANRAILVRFLRKSDKEQVLQARRAKRDLSVGHLATFHDALPAVKQSIVFVNESLSPARRAILREARELKRANRLSDVWVTGGKILVRKVTNGTKYVLGDLDALQELV